MTLLRNQLMAAGAEYRGIVFPGNLADAILGSSRESERWRISPVRVGAAILALAASIAIVFAPTAGAASPSLPAPSLVWTQGRPGFPGHVRISQAMLPAQPPAEVMSAIESPLMSCGSVFLNIGKDLAHRADALVQPM